MSKRMSSKIDLVECDACPTSGGCVGTCMKAAPVVERQPVALPNKMVPSGYDSDGSKGLRQGWNDFHDAMSKLGPLYTAPPELQALSVTSIMLDVVPGFDGMGEEVYAKSVADVQSAMTKLCDEIDELQAIIDTERKIRESAEGGWREANRVIAMQREKLDAQEAEIERLKGGQGEPEYWADAYDNTITAKHKSHNEKLGGAPLMVVERYTKPLYTSQPAPVSVEMSFDFEHPLSKEKRTVTLTKQDVFEGMEDYFYDKLAEQICQCESVGETNVVDCNCDEYVHDFEIVSACIDKVKELNQSTVIGFDLGEPGGDMTVEATFKRDANGLTLQSLERLERLEPASLCAASVGGVHCHAVRAPGGLFCAHHKSAKSRMYLPACTNEYLAFIMRRDGEQQ